MRVQTEPESSAEDSRREFGVIIALNQLGIAKELVDALFIGMVFAVALRSAWPSA